MQVSKEVASFCLSSFVFEGSRAWPRSLVAFFLSWGLAGAVAVVLAVGLVVILGSGVFYLPIMIQIKILNSIKLKSTLSFCGKMCVPGIFAVTNDVFLSARRGLYSVGSIPTLDPDPRI